jgi:hypothetical protein
MIDSGFNDSFWVALDSNAASNCWSGLVDEVDVVELVELVELESVLESEEDA